MLTGLCADGAADPEDDEEQRDRDAFGGSGALALVCGSTDGEEEHGGTEELQVCPLAEA